MVWFEAGVDYKRAVAAPMFVLCEGVDAVDVGGGIGPSEGDPEEIAERFSDELGVVDNEENAETGKRSWELRIVDCELRIGVFWTFDGEDTGEDYSRVFETVGKS